MDYEQKYKEALKWMQGLYSGLHGATKEEAEHYFPELKESEDERIKKDIISHLRNEKIVKRYISDIEVDKWIAWLEKQGEQQGKSALEAWRDMRFEVYQQASGNRHEANYSDDSTKMFSLNDIDEIIEKISEQKGGKD